jgi:glutamine cyclotransferase
VTHETIHPRPTTRPAEVIAELDSFDEGVTINGVEHDGRQLWVAIGPELRAVDPETGEVLRTLPVAADAGTTFDGKLLYQLTHDRIDKIDPATGEVVGSLPAPGGGRDSGLTWAEGRLWVGQYRDRKIYCIDPETGSIERTIQSDRFVTGVTWVDGELWHGTWEGDTSDVRRIDPQTGEVLECLDLPEGIGVSGLAAHADRLYCGGGRQGRIRVLRRPER